MNNFLKLCLLVVFCGVMLGSSKAEPLTKSKSTMKLNEKSSVNI